MILRCDSRDWLVALVLLVGCTRPSPRGTPAAPSPGEPEPTTKTAAPGALAAARAKATPEDTKELPKVADDDLKTEEREANPYSETVTLKLNVTPQAKALVTWGAKQIARLSPGNMDTEISRPRGSGPVDLEIKAEGFMPYHTRLYAGRNDKVYVRLYRVEEAPGLLGYKRTADKKK
jgi:hypothetical protein